METYFQYLLESTICLSIFYLAYLIILRKDSGFKFLRAYLLTAIIVSLLLPLNRYSIELFNGQPEIQMNFDVYKAEDSQAIQTNSAQTIENVNLNIVTSETPVNYMFWIMVLYISITIIFILKLAVGILTPVFYSQRFKVKRFNHLKVIRNNRFKFSFSFFNLVFIYDKDLSDKEVEGIVAHENIHVVQYHSIDLIVVELLSAVMWFNPLVWLLRNSLRQVHEYLADEGVLNIGFDRLEYQALLVNQVAESRLLSLASSFNHSQIKNRLIMMTKQKPDNRTKLKILALVPIAAALLFSISCFNSTNQNDIVTAVAATKMNVLYLGVDNPIAIATSGYDPSEIRVSIDNGTISGEKGQYVVRPAKTGEANVTVLYKEKEIQKSTFRVKTVPDPVAKVAGIKGAGAIDKHILLEQKEVVADMENFDFDLRFKTISFSVVANIGGNSITKVSKSSKFTQEQYDLIKKVKPGQKVYIEDVKAVGPDGSIRLLPPIALTLK